MMMPPVNILSEQFFKDRIITNNEHWLWIRYKTKLGYGQVSYKNKRVYAHRLSYEFFNNLSILPGYHIDHLCRTPSCINPKHLELVTPRDNCLRGTSYAAECSTRNHCDKGHTYKNDTTYKEGVRRRCRICARARDMVRRKKKVNITITFEEALQSYE